MTFWILWNPASDRPPKVRFTDIEEARKGAVAMAKRHGGTFYVMRSDGDATGEEKVVRSMEVTTTWKDIDLMADAMTNEWEALQAAEKRRYEARQEPRQLATRLTAALREQLHEALHNDGLDQ